MHLTTGQESWHTHRCDGCCRADDWLIADLKEGTHAANQLILEHKQALSEYSTETRELRDSLVGTSIDLAELLRTARRVADYDLDVVAFSDWLTLNFPRPDVG